VVEAALRNEPGLAGGTVEADVDGRGVRLAGRVVQTNERPDCIIIVLDIYFHEI
jgi:hypothetical protein